MTASDEPHRRGNSEETARRVLDAAAAEFVERGYDKAVISDIARRAGVTPGAVYPRWPHKSDLMAAALDHLLEQLVPENRMKDLGLVEMPTADVIAVWGADLLQSDSVKDVLVQVFGSARNNAAVRDRLQRFVNDQADQFNSLVERGKSEGYVDPDVDSVALTMFVQAVGIGTHLLLSAGLEDRHVPSEQNWVELLLQMPQSVRGTAEPQTGQDGEG